MYYITKSTHLHNRLAALEKPFLSMQARFAVADVNSFHTSCSDWRWLTDLRKSWTFEGTRSYDDFARRRQLRLPTVLARHLNSLWLVRNPIDETSLKAFQKSKPGSTTNIFWRFGPHQLPKSAGFDLGLTRVKLDSSHTSSATSTSI